jgi:Na+/H+ antiporter NhaA
MALKIERQFLRVDLLVAWRVAIPGMAARGGSLWPAAGLSRRAHKSTAGRHGSDIQCGLWCSALAVLNLILLGGEDHDILAS